MRAAFSPRRLALEERAALTSKVATRALSLSAVASLISIIASMKLLGYYGLEPYAAKLAIWSLLCVIVGCGTAVLAVLSVLFKLRQIICNLSGNKPNWNELNAEYMDSDLKYLYSSIKNLHDKARMSMFGDIALHIVHDMRSPLAVLLTFFKQHVATVQHAELMEAARLSVEKLERMSKDLLDNASAPKIERERVAFPAFINDWVLPEIWAASGGGQTDIEYQNDAGHEVIASIDLQKMSRVLINLLRNALEAITKPKGRVTLRTNVSPAGDLIITVADNGKGIRQEHLPRIFDDFYTFGKRGGSGLGLAYCRKVIEAHGGAIDVASEVDRGTVFRLTLPICVHPFAEAQQSPRTIIYCKNRPFILVEDDKDLRARLRRLIISKGGLIVDELERGDALINDAGRSTPPGTVALVDYRFEGSAYSGIDVIRELKSRGVEHIYLCSNYSEDPEIGRQALDAGAIDVFDKSLSGAELREGPSPSMRGPWPRG